MIGPLTEEQEELMQKNPRFLGLKFPQTQKMESLEKHYSGKMCPEALDLMRKLLQMEPGDRIQGVDVLNHPYFDPIRDTSTAHSSSIGSTRPI